MGNPRRMFRQGDAAFVTNRLAEGLPFVPTLYINVLLFGILARACFKHPNIIICAWLFLGSHYHGLIVNRGSAEELRSFMNYVDGEIAKIVCKLLGRWNVKIWAQRYHYAPIETWDACLRQMSYLFLNPVVANLVAKASAYPGVSTYAWLTPGYRQEYIWVKPSLVTQLANGRFLRSTSKRLAAALKEMNLPSYGLPIHPFAWKECFSESSQLSDEQLKGELLTLLTEGEFEAERLRRKEGKTVCDLTHLVEQNPHRRYKSKKFGKRGLCISTCPEARAEYIRIYRDFCEKCIIAWHQAKVGYRDAAFPLGAFIPPQLPRGNQLRYVT